MRLPASIAVLLVASAGVVAEQGVEQPRFRDGANLVRVEAYVTANGQPVTDLTGADVEVLEDDSPQTLETFELVTPHSHIPDAARLFTFFFDTHHVASSGIELAQASMVEKLDTLIHEDDYVGAMTSELIPGHIVYSRRMNSVGRFLSEYGTLRPRNERLRDQMAYALMRCYPDRADIAQKIIARHREDRALKALDQLVTHLDGLRAERKFVIVFSKGWLLPQRDESLAADVRPEGPPATDATSESSETCERQRVRLANLDYQVALRELLQHANRANVSFYPVDADGLAAVERRDGESVPADQTEVRRRAQALQTMAGETGGLAILKAPAFKDAVQRLIAQAESYYRLTYYSTNTTLDGRFRRIGVRTKREGVDVRARRGYLGPTEAEARAAGVVIPEKTNRLVTLGAPSVPSALDGAARARGTLPLRIQAAGGAAEVRAVIELDSLIVRSREWVGGGEMKLIIEHEQTGQSYVMNGALEPGQKSVIAHGPTSPLAPGRYAVKAELTARGSRAPLQVTTLAEVPPAGAIVGTGALAARRGPSTGLSYQPTADTRFRRTERIRIEVPLIADSVTTTGRLVNREGHALPLHVTTSERAEGTMKFAAADVSLAPLAPGEYAIELSCAANGATETVSYPFRIVP